MSTQQPTVESAHEVVIGIAALVVFVTVGVMLAGQSDQWADVILVFFAMLALLQLITGASAFQTFLSAHPVLTGQIPQGGSS